MQFPRPYAIGESPRVDAEVVLYKCVVEEEALHTHDLYPRID